MNAELLNTVAGGTDLLEWFGGHAPSFHDAEVLGVTLDREGARCILKVHAFEMTSEVDRNGYFVCTRHAVVTFELGDVTSLELADFNHQNAIMGLSVVRSEDGGFGLEVEPAYGLSGVVEARSLRISIEPGIPAGSQYLRLAQDAPAADTPQPNA